MVPCVGPDAVPVGGTVQGVLGDLAAETEVQPHHQPETNQNERLEDADEGQEKL